MTTDRFLIATALVCIPWVPATAQEPASIAFRKLLLTDKYYCDGIQAGDINRDGRTDIVAGPFWYPGPTFEDAHAFYPAQELPPEESPSNSMFSFVHDLSGDGWPDIIVLGRVHKHAAYWYENPGQSLNRQQHWNKHFIFERVRGESPALVNLFGDHRRQLITHWDGRWGWIEPHHNEPRRPWRFVPIESEAKDWPQFYHGEGVGDVNSDGRADLIINDGWFEQPASAVNPWAFHKSRFSQQRGGAQIFCDDLDSDGDSDVITALHAHEWGLAWLEQVADSAAQPVFRQHTIMGDRQQESDYGVAFSQPHALDYADVDGDGLKDIVIGKRRWAHGPTGDVEPGAAPVVYWFQQRRINQDQQQKTVFVPHLIDDASGVGTQIQAVDVNGDGRTDVLTASKLGSFVFLNEPE